jgi:hypothetical protein
VDRVLVSYAASDAAATAGSDSKVFANRNQWYVAISRGREKVTILTEDKEALRLRIEQASRNRELALSLKPMAMTEVEIEAETEAETETEGKTVQEIRKRFKKRELVEPDSSRLYREMMARQQAQSRETVSARQAREFFSQSRPSSEISRQLHHVHHHNQTRNQPGHSPGQRRGIRP